MIRAATPADLPELVAMVQALAAHHGDTSQISEAALARDLFAPQPWLQALVAEGSKRLIGYAALTQLTRLQYGQRGFDIHHLFVVADHRGRGLGKALITAILDHARAQGCSYITVSALEGNLPARAFYAAQGFQDAPVKGLRYAKVIA
jgi:GNAT superfamily N-acetyltransferase